MSFSPYIIAVLAAIGYAVQPALAKKMQLDVPPLIFIAATTFFLSVFSVLSSLFFEKDYSLSQLTPRIVGGLVLFACVNFISFALFMAAIAKVPVAQYQLIGLITPIVGGFFAYLLLKEPFRVQYLVGLAFIAVGLFIALKKTGGGVG